MADRRHAPLTKPHGRGTLRLVLIASAVGLPACGDDPADVSQPLLRPMYDKVESCVQDWGSEADCEPGVFDEQALDKARAASGAGTTAAAGGHGTAVIHSPIWWGPYYSRAGTVYRYDGRQERLAHPPRLASGMKEHVLSPRQVYTVPGRYATTPTHPRAGAGKLAATGRGGFGGIGRGGGFSGGG